MFSIFLSITDDENAPTTTNAEPKPQPPPNVIFVNAQSSPKIGIQAEIGQKETENYFQIYEHMWGREEARQKNTATTSTGLARKDTVDSILTPLE